MSGLSSGFSSIIFSIESGPRSHPPSGNWHSLRLTRTQHFEDVVCEEGWHGGAVLVDGLEDLDEDLQRGDGWRSPLGLVRDHRRQVLVRVARILPE